MSTHQTIPPVSIPVPIAIKRRTRPHLGFVLWTSTLMQLTSTLVVCPQATNSHTCCRGQLGDKTVETKWLIKWCEKLETTIITSHHGWEVHHLLQAISSMPAFFGDFFGVFFFYIYIFLNLFKLFLGLLWQINCDILHLGYCCRISLFLLTANDTNCLPNTWIALEHLGRKQLAIMFLSWKSQ